MISLPDFKEKQILFVNTEWGKPSHLRFYNDNIVFEQEKKVVNRVSVHKTFAVFICGDLSFTTGFVKQAKEHGISIFLLKHNFEMYGGLTTTAEGHYALRMKQYALSKEDELVLAKKLITNKIENQAAILRKQKLSEDEKSRYLELASSSLATIATLDDNESLLGVEGNFSRSYFVQQFKNMDWRRRAPRTKEDINNFLMDMGYTLLFNFVDSLLRLHGFDTYKGFYHKLFFQRRSLSCDIMEPLRPLIDYQIVKMNNLGQLKKSDFIVVNRAFTLPFEFYPKYAGIFLQCLMDHKEDIFQYVHGFYRHIMDPQKNDFPIFKIP